MRFLLRLTLFYLLWIFSMFWMFWNVRIFWLWSFVFGNLWMGTWDRWMNDWFIAKTKRFISCLYTTTLVSSLLFTLFFIITFTFAYTSTLTSVYLLLIDALRTAFLFIFCTFLTNSWFFCGLRLKYSRNLAFVRYIFFNSEWAYCFFRLFYCVIINNT